MVKNDDGNKHGEMTAATLKRLAKGCRKLAKPYPKSTPRAQDWRALGALFDEEATFVRRKP